MTPTVASLGNRPSAKRIADCGPMAEKLWLGSMRRMPVKRPVAAAPPTVRLQPLQPVRWQEAELTRFIKADYTADRLQLSVDEDCHHRAELFTAS